MAEAPKPADKPSPQADDKPDDGPDEAPLITASTKPAVVAPGAAVAPVAPRAEDKPEHTHYEVLVDQWGADFAERPAPKKGDVIEAANIGPNHRWAVANGVVRPITAKEAAAREERAADEDPHVVQTRIDVQRTQAAEDRQNRTNLQRQV